MPFLFPFEPDWSSPVEVEIAYKTEVLTSRNFREQRLALRSQPRKSIRFEVTALRSVYQKFMQQIAARQQAEWVVPEIVRPAFADGAASGATSLSFPARPVWVRPQSWVVVKLPSGLQLRQVLTATTTAFTFATPLPEAVPAGASVFPGLIGRLSQSMSGSTPTNAALKGTVELAADPGANFFEEETVAPITFNGRELWLRRSNWGTVPSLDFEGRLETVDYDRGVVTHFSPVIHNVLRVQREYVARGHAEAQELTSFLHRMKGQRGEFYAPSVSHDLDPSVGAAAASSFLDVPGTETATLFAASPVHRAVFVRFADGSYQANVVTGITVSGSNSRIAVANPWTQAVSSGNARMVSWLYAMRLSADTVTMEWLTDSVARAKLAAQTLEDLP